MFLKYKGIIFFININFFDIILYNNFGGVAVKKIYFLIFVFILAVNVFSAKDIFTVQAFMPDLKIARADFCTVVKISNSTSLGFSAGINLPFLKGNIGDFDYNVGVGAIVSGGPGARVMAEIGPWGAKIYVSADTVNGVNAGILTSFWGGNLKIGAGFSPFSLIFGLQY